MATTRPYTTQLTKLNNYNKQVTQPQQNVFLPKELTQAQGKQEGMVGTPSQASVTP